MSHPCTFPPGPASASTPEPAPDRRRDPARGAGDPFATYLPLEELIDEIDRSPEPGPAAVVLRVTERPLQVGRLVLDVAAHPLDLLLGFSAPAGWAALGLRCHGHAYDLCPDARSSPDQPPPGRDPAPPAGDERVEPVPVVVTVLLDRAGRGAGTLRRGASVTRLDGPPEGVVGDACRRALGLATEPPPSGTVDLWLRVWLDRLAEAAVLADDPSRFGSWSAVAALHPAAPGQPTSLRANARSTREPPAAADPYMLADATLQLAAIWPWSRLRADPEVVDTGQPPLPRHLTRWMDDGMFARWVLSDLVALDVLAATLTELLPGDVTAAIAETVTIAAGSWPSPTAVGP